MTRYVRKALAGIQDFLVGQGSVVQTRNNVEYSIDKINADNLPYSGDEETADFVSIKAKIDLLEGKTQYIGAIDDSEDFILSGINLSIVKRATMTPYQLAGGQWTVEGQAVITLSAPTTSFILSLSGTAFKNITDFDQAVTASVKEVGVGDMAVTRHVAVPNTGTIEIAADTDFDFISLTFKLELESQPTWAV